MKVTTFVTGLIGIAMMIAFVGVLVWWIKAWPLTIIVIGVCLMMIYDFVKTLRENGVEFAKTQPPGGHESTGA